MQEWVYYLYFGQKAVDIDRIDTRSTGNASAIVSPQLAGRPSDSCFTLNFYFAPQNDSLTVLLTLACLLISAAQSVLYRVTTCPEPDGLSSCAFSPAHNGSLSYQNRSLVRPKWCLVALSEAAHFPIASLCLAACFLVILACALSPFTTSPPFSIQWNSMWQLEERYGLMRPWAR